MSDRGKALKKWLPMIIIGTTYFIAVVIILRLPLRERATETTVDRDESVAIADIRPDPTPQPTERPSKCLKQRHVMAIGGCDLFGYCGVTYSNGETDTQRLPAVGQSICLKWKD